MRTRIGECFDIFFCRSSESSPGGSSFVALAGSAVVALAGGSVVGLVGSSVVGLVGKRLLFSPRHVTGVNAAAKAAVSTSARSTVAPIIAIPPDVDPCLPECLESVAFVGQTQTAE